MNKKERPHASIIAEAEADARLKTIEECKNDLALALGVNQNMSWRELCSKAQLYAYREKERKNA